MSMTNDSQFLLSARLNRIEVPNFSVCKVHSESSIRQCRCGRLLCKHQDFKDGWSCCNGNKSNCQRSNHRIQVQEEKVLPAEKYQILAAKR